MFELSPSLQYVPGVIFQFSFLEKSTHQLFYGEDCKVEGNIG